MSDQDPSIGDVLSGEDSAPAPVVETKGETAAPPAAETKADPVDKAAQSRDESGKFAKAGAKAAAEATSDVKTETVKPLPNVAGIIDERRKRQAAEARVRELEQQQPQAKPSVFDNEDEAIRTRVDEATRPLREAHYNLSMRYARQIHGEQFSAAEAAFMEAAEANPSLYEGLRASSDPGEYVFMHGIFHKEMSEVGGNILAYREKVTADTAAKLTLAEKENLALKAEIAALKQAKSDLEQIPTSLNSRASSAPAPNELGPEEPLSQIVRFGTKRS